MDRKMILLLCLMMIGIFVSAYSLGAAMKQDELDKLADSDIAIASQYAQPRMEIKGDYYFLYYPINVFQEDNGEYTLVPIEEVVAFSKAELASCVEEYNGKAECALNFIKPTAEGKLSGARDAYINQAIGWKAANNKNADWTESDFGIVDLNKVNKTDGTVPKGT